MQIIGSRAPIGCGGSDESTQAPGSIEMPGILLQNRSIPNQENAGKKQKKYFRLVVAHARRHAAHSTHAAHAARGHTLGCVAL